MSRPRLYAMSLIEVIVSVALVGMLLLTAYSALQSIGQSQALFSRLIDNNTQITGVYERISQLIQQGGTIDYEEYYNRSKIGDTSSTSTLDSVNPISGFDVASLF
jgi:prepilin-type N-terminal cleavage/methylation domain-containing protein